MRRREVLLGFTSAVGQVAVGSAHAQQPITPRIAFVGTATAESDDRPQRLAVALREYGYFEGRNIWIERRFANNDHARLRAIADELSRGPVDLIVVTTAGVASVFRSTTNRIPIVVWSAGDLEGTGLIESLRRPGSNVTGIQILSPDLMTKRLELLGQLVPGLQRVGFVKPITPAGFITNRYVEVTEDAARAQGISLRAVEVYNPAEFEGAFSRMAQVGLQGALVIANPLSTDHRVALARAAALAGLPTMFELREFVKAGGLISYGVVREEFASMVAGYVQRILSGASAADLPVQQPTRFELLINLQTANALGITIPPTLLARADEVIE